MAKMLTCKRCGEPIAAKSLERRRNCPRCGGRLHFSLLDGIRAYVLANLPAHPVRKAVGFVAGTMAVLYIIIVLALLLVLSSVLRSPLGLPNRSTVDDWKWVILLSLGLIPAVALAHRLTRHVVVGRGLARMAVALSLTVVPVSLLLVMLSAPHDDSEADALGYCRNISTATLLFHKDTGTWPIYMSADHSPESRVDYLYGNMGDMPRFTDGEVAESWGTRSQDMSFQLVTNGKQEPIYPYRTKDASPPRDSDSGPRGWDGPYLPYVTDDPWGYAYLISVSGFEGGTKPDNHVWCLSAGPNGIVDTPAWATATRGDDIGYRTK